MADTQVQKIKDLFGGKWGLDRSENFEEFLKEMGWDAEKIKNVIELKPTDDIKVEGDVITISTDAGAYARQDVFTLGKEYDIDNQGEKVKVITVLDESDKLLTNATSDDPKLPKTIRYVSGEEMCFELHIGDIVCKRHYKRL